MRQAQARRHRRRVFLRWRADRAPADCRRGPHRARPHRLRGLVVGQPGHPLVRPHPVPHRDDHRSLRDRRGDGARREAPVPRHQAGHRQLRAGRGVHLQHLRHRADRRRRGGRLPRRHRALGHPGGAGGCGRLLRHQEPGQPAGGRGHVQARDRHPRARTRRPPRRRAAHLRREPDRRIQHRRRVLACAAALRRAGPAHPVHPVGRRPLPRGADHAPGEGEHGGVRQGAAQRGPQDGRQLRHPVLRGQLLRRAGHEQRPARLRPDHRRRRPDRPHRGRHRPGGGQVPRRARPLARAPRRQARAALHRRREVLVHRLGPAGSGHEGGRHRHQEVD